MSAQVHISVATRNVVQGARGYDGALHLARMVAACPSLHLRGLTSADGDLQVGLMSAVHASLMGPKSVALLRIFTHLAGACPIAE